MTDDHLKVHTAYAIKSSADCKNLYADWAANYDEGFAATNDFIFPQQVADVFQRRGGSGPVLDAGAGTGLLAQAILRGGPMDIDAFDFSAEMLAIARQKGLYRDVFEGDLTKPLPFNSETYRGVVSSGTFTHGHVGPEALDELFRVAQSGAVFALSVKTEIFKDNGFEAKFQSFGSGIRDFVLDERPVYGAGADADHAGDTALVASFIKT